MRDYLSANIHKLSAREQRAFVREFSADRNRDVHLTIDTLRNKVLRRAYAQVHNMIKNR